jgi:hypothetical protein
MFKEIVKKLPYRWFVVLFMLFFLYEYGVPVVNGFQIGSKMGLGIEEMIGNRQIVKHFLRLPIYGLLYLWLLQNLKTPTKGVMWFWRFTTWSHLIFKPLTTIYVGVMLMKIKYFGNIGPITIVWGIIIGIFYALAVGYMEQWWREKGEVKAIK